MQKWYGTPVHVTLHPLIASLASWTLKNAASWPLQRSCDAPGRCNCCFLASATGSMRRSWCVHLLLPAICNAPATLMDAATAASWPLQRSCNAPGRCNCCFLASATLLQRSRTLQLLLPGLCNAPATLLDAARLLPGLCNTHGIMLTVQTKLQISRLAVADANCDALSFDAA